MAKLGGGLHAICAKLKSSRPESDVTEQSSSREDTSPQGKVCAESGDINSNGLKDTVHKLLPQGEDDFAKQSADIAEIDLQNRQQDLASSNSSSISSTSFNEASSSQSSASKFTTGRKNRRKNATPKNLCQMKDVDSELSHGKDFYSITDDMEIYRTNNPDVDFNMEAAAVNSDSDQEHAANESHDILMNLPFNELHQRSIRGVVLEDPDADMRMDVPGEAPLDLTGSQSYSRTDSLAECSSLENSYNTDDYGALDLSIGSNKSEKKSQMSDLPAPVCELSTNQTSASDLGRNMARRKPSPRPSQFMRLPPAVAGGISEGKPITAQPHSGANADHMKTELKNYAESTVNELLSMYGLGENVRESELPTIQDELLRNLAAGKIPNWSEADCGMKKTLQPAKRKEIGKRDQTIIKKSKYAENSGASVQRSPASFHTTGTEEAENSGPIGSQPAKIGALYSPLKDSSCPDYGKYVSRYNSYEQCKQDECEKAQLREHFHCRECPTKVLMKKDEMIRHFKWHRKRDESLQHGFMRYSPLDDCSKRFLDCTHNGRQTHYHCIQNGCNKVYISTSDVQMHANYHRKDSAIMQLGFQRFRATEDCANLECPFYGQRTTHFHCRRPNCTFAFKNKADIEKHKTFHQKDDILAKDGFKKFMKYDSCFYPGCRYSKVSNHIHCVRPGCDYVLHSTSQLLSHKRKHERREIEFAYRKYKTSSASKDQATAMLNPALLPYANQVAQPSTFSPNPTKDESSDNSLMDYLTNQHARKGDEFDAKNDDTESTSSAMTEERVDDMEMTNDDEMMNSEPEEEDDEDELGASGDLLSKTHPGALNMVSRINPGANLGGSLNLPLPNQLREAQAKLATNMDKELNPEIGPDSPQLGKSPLGFVPKTSPPVNEKKERDETWKKFLTRYTANDPCHSRCQFLYKDHYHCNSPTCGMLFRSKDGVRDHARHHEQLDRITELSYMGYAADAPCVETCEYYQTEKHYHCLWTGCDEVIPETGNVFQRLEHYHTHEYARSNGRKTTLNFLQKEANLKRRRGRPPKYPKHDIPVVPKIEMDETTIQAQADVFGANDPIAYGYKKFESHEACADDKCVYNLKEHYHCVRQRCHHATDNKDVLNLHAKDFHSFVTIQEGFEFFDRNVNCRRPHCHNNKVNRHFHCVRPKCDYSFVRYSTMSQHNKKHVMAEMGLTISPGVAITNASLQSGEAPGNQMNAAKNTVAQGILRGADGLPVLLPNPVSAAQIPVKSSPVYFPINTCGQTVCPISSVAQPIISNPIHGLTESHTIVPTISPTTSVAPIVIQPIDDVDSVPASAPTVTSPLKITLPVLPKPSDIQNNLPLASLLQQKGSNITPQMNWTQMLVKMHYSINSNCGRPFCKLKKKDHYHCFDCNQAFCDPIRLKNHATKHGVILDSANNISGRFLPRMAVPQIVTTQPNAAEIQNAQPVTTLIKASEMSQLNSDSDSDDDIQSSSLNLNPMEFTNMLQKSQKENLDLERESAEPIRNTQAFGSSAHGMLESDDYDDERPLEIDENATSDETPGETSSVNQENTSAIRRSTRKRSISRQYDFSDCDETAPDAKKYRTSAVSPRAASRSRRTPSNSMDIPDGFGRYTSTIDCMVERCTYRLNLTHYHCCRTDCIFGTADRSRLQQHTERHRKTDEVLGNEFRQFKLAQDCDRADCEHSGKSTHYHCLKCPFICLELSKVQAHRKHHQKQEAISAQGFLKVMASETCCHNSCSYSGRQTHYHCTQNGGKCNFIAHGQQMISNHNKAFHPD